MKLLKCCNWKPWLYGRAITGCQAMCLVFTLFIFVVAPVRADNVTQLLVQLQPAAAQAGVESQASGISWVIGKGVGLQLPVVRTIGDTIVVVRLPEAVSVQQARVLAQRLMEDPDVNYAEPDRPVHSHAFVPNDPLFFQQWYLSSDLAAEPASSNAQSAWSDGQRGSSDVVIAQLDSGFLAHEDLDNRRILPGYDFIADPVAANDGDGRDPDPSDPGDGVQAGECDDGGPDEDENSSWHGLQVAGVMMATVDNAIGITGIDHFAKLLPIRVLGKCGGLSSDILDAMRWAVGLSVSGVPSNLSPAAVINLSLGGDGPCGVFEQRIINEVVATGAVIVASAGNGSGSVDSPANCDNVIAVAAVGRDGALAGYSNIGQDVTISAPGGTGFDGIFSTYNTGTLVPAADSYAALQGTSITAPQVSAAVALMFSANPNVSVSQVQAALNNSARPFPDISCNTSLCGAGLLDIAAAVQAVIGLPLDSNPGAGSGDGGGGCTTHAGAAADPLFPGIVLIAWLALLRRRCK